MSVLLLQALKSLVTECSKAEQQLKSSTYKFFEERYQTSSLELPAGDRKAFEDYIDDCCSIHFALGFVLKPILEFFQHVYNRLEGRPTKVFGILLEWLPAKLVVSCPIGQSDGEMFPSNSQGAIMMDQMRGMQQDECLTPSRNPQVTGSQQSVPPPSPLARPRVLQQLLRSTVTASGENSGISVQTFTHTPRLMQASSSPPMLTGQAGK